MAWPKRDDMGDNLYPEVQSDHSLLFRIDTEKVPEDIRLRAIEYFKLRLLHRVENSTEKYELYKLSHLDGEPEERLICATCVTRLREASSFRRQVLHCEEKLLQTTIHIHEDKDDKVKAEFVVKQESDDNCDSQLNDDDNTNNTLELDDITVHVKVEPLNETLDKQVKKTIKRKSLNKKVGKDDNLKGRKEMLLKMKKLSEKLDKMQGNDKPTSSTQIKQPKQINEMKTMSIDKDYNALRNAITIVENSYVCPFSTTFSDYFCVYCREMFTDPNKLRDHTMTHDPMEYKNVVDNKKIIQIDIIRIDCRLCQKRIDDLDTLKGHITNIHGKVLYSDISNEFLKFRLKLGSLSCTECDRTFSFFHALKKHMADHFGTFICDVCGVHYFEERHLLLHRKTHKSEHGMDSFPCDQCGKTFKSKNSRYFHIARIHKNEPAYPCNKCDEVLLSYYLRYRHKMEVHGEQRTFPCERCDKVYDSRKSLREHNRRNHLQVLRHECTYCDKKFYLPSALKDHMTSHTGERNFRCEYCGKSYPRLRALRVHMQSHNSEKKYKCTICTASYTQVNNYKNHMKSKHQMPEFNESFQV